MRYRSLAFTNPVMSSLSKCFATARADVFEVSGIGITTSTCASLSGPNSVLMVAASFSPILNRAFSTLMPSARKSIPGVRLCYMNIPMIESGRAKYKYLSLRKRWQRDLQEYGLPQICRECKLLRVALAEIVALSL